MFSIDFLNSIRSSLVVRVEELKVTEQEHALLNFLLFCNPGNLIFQFNPIHKLIFEKSNFQPSTRYLKELEDS